MKKVLLIKTSARKNSNSNILAERFAEGAREAGNEVEVINLPDYQINSCLGCYACEKMDHCIQKDDMNQLLEKLGQSEVVCFSTPVYFYGMSGQMKTFLDRTMTFYFHDHAFKEVYLLAACESDDPKTLDPVVQGLDGRIRCFDGLELKGTCLSTSSLEAKKVLENQEALDKAFELGRAS